MKKIFIIFAVVFLSIQASSQNAAYFNGVSSFVTANTGLNPSDDFTVEGWFRYDGPISTTSIFQRVFSINGLNSRFEFGVDATSSNIAYFFVPNTLPPGSPSNHIVDSTPTTGCHHFAVVRQGPDVNIYLDGVLIIPLVGFLTSNFNSGSTIQIGTWNSFSSSYWQGLIYGVRVWNQPRTQAEIQNGMNGVSPLTPGLMTYLKMDAIVLPNLFVDNTPNGNDGTISPGGIAINASCSPSACVRISNYWDKSMTLTELCNEEPAVFELLTPSLPLIHEIVWQYSEQGSSIWIDLNSPPFAGTNFPTAIGDISMDCSTSLTGHEDREYRALITYIDPMTGLLWDEPTKETPLKICCPLTPSTINLLPSDPACVGDLIDYEVTLSPGDAFVNSASSNPDLTIDWSLSDGTLLPLEQNNLTINYTQLFPDVTAPTDFCFIATVSNCQSKLGEYVACITYDPKPVCGNIEGKPLPAALTQTIGSPNPVYQICRGDNSTIGAILPSGFDNCIVEWEYSFGGTVFQSEGSISNLDLNTNVLPWNNGTWSAGENQIYYRIKCSPLSDPSGCLPCFGDTLLIQIKDPPMPPIIAGLDETCGDDFPINLTVMNNPGAVTYEWFHNGISIGTGDNFLVNEPGCYWAEGSNNCGTTKGNMHCITLCEVAAVISCPLVPNDCACLGDPIVLDASMSQFNCPDNSDLSYLWDFPEGPSTAEQITSIPLQTGTTYYLTVTDNQTGCSSATSTTIIPCDKN